MPDPFIVGPTGLPLYRYADWRLVVETRWKAAYGPDTDVRPETPDGLIIDIWTLFLTLQGDATQSVFANSFFRTADQVALPLLLDVFGRGYLPATDTTVSGAWYGTAATVVHDGSGTGPVASVVSVGDTNLDRYEVDDGASGTIPGDDGQVIVLVLVQVSDGNDYSVDIDSTETTPVTAGPADTTQTIAVLLAAQILIDQPTWTVSTPGQRVDGAALVVLEGKEFETVEDGATISDDSELDIFGAVRLAMSAEQTGARQCLAGTLLTIETPAAGLEGVVNTTDGLVGRDLETPAELRARHYDQINSGGKGTPQAIRAALLDQLRDPLVEYARVDENISDATDSGGRPPHSFEATWIGTATDEQVAAVVFDQKPAGIRSFGSTQVDVTDDLGEVHVIEHSHGVELFLHMTVTVTAGEGFPTTGDPGTTIELAIVEHLQAVLGLGQDFYRSENTFAAKSVVAGIVSVVTLADATPLPGDAPTLIGADIPAATNEILRVDSSRITMVIV